MAAKMPRMTSTSSSSIKVKPARGLRRGKRAERMFRGFIFMIRVSGSFDMFLQGENRNDHPDEDGPDKSGDEEKHQRLGKRNGGFQLPIQVAFRDIGDADQFLIEFAAFFRDGYHFEHRAAE